MTQHLRHLTRSTAKLLWLGLFAASLSVTMGLLEPSKSAQTHPLPIALGSPVEAQEVPSVTSDEVQSYARSVLDVETLRLSAYDRIKTLLGTSDVPPIACHIEDSLSGLRREVRDIVVEFCTQSIEVVRNNRLTIARFNTITSLQQSDEDLASRIQEELLRLQTDGVPDEEISNAQ
ncbi:MAG: DUF4168 domain-containing protein [Synechococcales bacterium]|nr:DUF4168 domain-containing protein [Synechococcales bacterium]